MPQSRILIAGTPCLRTSNDAADGSATQPQMDGGLRLRHAAPHLSHAGPPPPVSARLCAMRGSRRRWRKLFLKWQGEGNRVPPRIGAYS